MMRRIRDWLVVVVLLLLLLEWPSVVSQDDWWLCLLGGLIRSETKGEWRGARRLK